MDQGRRPELVGGGLIRSLGGWSEVRQKLRAEARSVFCYWAVRELGVAGVAYAVDRGGEKIVKDNGFMPGTGGRIISQVFFVLTLCRIMSMMHKK